MINISKYVSHKTFAIISGVVFIFMSLLLWIYHAQQIKEDERARQQLEAEISRQIFLYKNGEAKTIDLSKVASSSWDRLFIFGPYTTLGNIQETLGYSWKPSIRTFLGADTPFNLLVFTYERKVVRYVDYPRVLGEFSGASDETGKGYKPHAAVFVINEYGYILWAGQ